MKSSHAHLLKLTIAGLNALAMHTEQSLFCRSIRRHIGTMDGDQGDTITCIKLIAQRLTDVAAVAEEH